ncbi:MAG: hypothetical protein QNL24_10130 [Akkermansiaceae bacterium]|jgi:hypothetical protein
MNTSHKNILTSIAITGFLATSSQADTIVQWGADGGDTEIVTSGNADSSSTSTSYTAGNTITEPVDYYGGYDGSQTPLFNGSMEFERKLEVRDSVDGDYFGIAFNTGTASVNRPAGPESATRTAMFVWETANMINGGGEGQTITNFSSQSRLRNGGASDEDGRIRYLVEESGQFYISEEFELTAVDHPFNDVSVDPTSLSWFNYTPFSGDTIATETIGATDVSESLTFKDVSAVGLWTESRDSTTQFTGVFTRNFQVIAVSDPSDFRIVNIERIVVPGVGMEADTLSVSVRWNSSASKTYGVFASSDLADFSNELEDTWPGATGETTTSYTEQGLPIDTVRRFYRITDTTAP